MTGEILIGVGVARRHAKKARLLLQHELTLYLIHGLLHLCGFDDMDPVSRKKCVREKGSTFQDWVCLILPLYNNY